MTITAGKPKPTPQTSINLLTQLAAICELQMVEETLGEAKNQFVQLLVDRGTILYFYPDDNDGASPNEIYGFSDKFGFDIEIGDYADERFDCNAEEDRDGYPELVLMRQLIMSLRLDSRIIEKADPAIKIVYAVYVPSVLDEVDDDEEQSVQEEGDDEEDDTFDLHELIEDLIIVDTEQVLRDFADEYTPYAKFCDGGSTNKPYVYLETERFHIRLSARKSRRQLAVYTGAVQVAVGTAQDPAVDPVEYSAGSIEDVLTLISEAYPMPEVEDEDEDA